jgi:hypothetical protein
MLLRLGNLELFFTRHLRDLETLDMNVTSTSSRDLREYNDSICGAT